GEVEGGLDRPGPPVPALHERHQGTRAVAVAPDGGARRGGGARHPRQEASLRPGWTGGGLYRPACAVPVLHQRCNGGRGKRRIAPWRVSRRRVERAMRTSAPVDPAVVC